MRNTGKLTQIFFWNFSVPVHERGWITGKLIHANSVTTYSVFGNYRVCVTARNEWNIIFRQDALLWMSFSVIRLVSWPENLQTWVKTDIWIIKFWNVPIWKFHVLELLYSIEPLYTRLILNFQKWYVSTICVLHC